MAGLRKKKHKEFIPARKPSLAYSKNIEKFLGEVSADAMYGESFRSPLLEAGQKIIIKNEVEHAFFLRIFELYRVLELLQRSIPSLIETYSKFRERKQFVEVLQFRYFLTLDKLIARFDPGLTANMLLLYNQILELKIFLRYTDALPSTIETHIRDNLLVMQEQWNSLVDGIYERYGWNFKKL